MSNNSWTYVTFTKPQTSLDPGSKMRSIIISQSLSLSLTLASFSALAPTAGRSFPTGSKSRGWHLADPVTLFQLPDLKDKTYSSSFNKIRRKNQPENKKKITRKDVGSPYLDLRANLVSQGKVALWLADPGSYAHSYVWKE